MKLYPIGLSTDERTNKWKIICDCGKDFIPETTLLSRQIIECPKCKTNFMAFYNDEPPKLIKLKVKK
jgi:hypothetical protein